MEYSTLFRRRVLLVLLAACGLVCVSLYFLLGHSCFDLIGHWQICRYTLLGQNPYPMIGVDGPLGSIPPGFSTVPWSCFLGNVFYGGFIPLQQVWIYNLALHLVGAAVTATALYKAAKPMADKRLWLPIALVIFAHFSFAYSLLMGNAGGILCCALMLAILLAERRPWLAGILLALAMVKPQVAAVVCVVFLLNRRWKALFFAAAIDIVAWGVTCVLTATDPLTLLSQTFSSGTASDLQYLGLLSPLRFLGINSTLILGMNMLLGLLYTVGGWLWLRRKFPGATGSVMLYVPGCVASIIWMYKNGTDYSILSFCALFFCLLIWCAPLSRRDFWVATVGVDYWMMSRCGVYLVITLFESPVLRDVIKSIDGFVIAGIGLMLCHMWVRYRGEDLLPDDMKQTL